MIKTLRYSLLSLLVLVCGSAFAQKTVTFDATVDSYGGNENTNDIVLTKDGVTLSVSQGNFGNGSQFRIFKGQTITVSTGSGNLTSIVFTCTASGTAKYGPGCFAALEGYSYDDKVGTWTGTASEVTFTAESNQVRATTIEVTVAATGEVVVSKPTISGEEYFLASTEVTLEAAEGDIYYTIDGTDPSTSSTKYSAPFKLDATATVKAIAVKGGKASAVAEKEFEKVVPTNATIASLNEMTEDTKWVKLDLNGAVVTYIDGNNYYLREGDKALMLYGFDFSSHGTYPIEVGNILDSYAIVDYDNYYGIHEVKPNSLTDVNDWFVSSTSQEFGPTSATLAEILDIKHICDYVEVYGKIVLEVSGTKTNYYVVDDQDNKVQLYKGLDVSGYADDNKNYYITAVFNAIYNGNPELQPIAVSETSTSVEGVKAEAADNGAIYNLAGQKRSKLAKGINIVNGKKVVK